MSLVFMAILPVLIFGFIIYKKDRDKEPMGLLTKLLIFGVLSCFPALILEMLYVGLFSDNSSMIGIFCNYVIGVAFVEELCKFLPAYLFGVKSKYFDDCYDAMVYTAFTALGFAGFENVLYVLDGGTFTAILRAFLAVPGHMAYGLVMGYFLSLAYKCKKDNDIKMFRINIINSLLIPTLFHGLYDFTLMAGIKTYNFIAIGFIMLVDIGIIIHSFIKANKVSSLNEKLEDNTFSKHSGFKYIVFEIFVFIILISLFNIRFNEYFNVYYIGDKFNIIEDNVEFVVDSYSMYSDEYLVIDINIYNNDNELKMLYLSNFFLSDLTDDKSSIKPIDIDNIYPIVFDSMERKSIKIYFEIPDKDLDIKNYSLIYNTNNDKNQYAIMLDSIY